MDQVLIADLIHVPLGAVRLLLVGSLSPFVDHRAGIPIEGAAVPVAFDEVLLQLGADVLEEVAQVSDDRVVAQDRVFLLQQISRGQTG